MNMSACVRRSRNASARTARARACARIASQYMRYSKADFLRQFAQLPVATTVSAAARSSCAPSDRDLFGPGNRAAATPDCARTASAAAVHRGGTALRQHVAVRNPGRDTAASHLGGEAHWLVELIPQLKPGAPGVDSNRLTAEHYTPDVEQLILDGILDNLRDSRGQAVESAGRRTQAAREDAEECSADPVFARIFPDARFIFLWREPGGTWAASSTLGVPVTG